MSNLSPNTSCGSWGSVLPGCSAEAGGDWTAHFKPTDTAPTNCDTSLYQVVCAAKLKVFKEVVIRMIPVVYNNRSAV